MRIAVEGCCHGALDEIYRAIAEKEHYGGFKVDLLLICGDFQAIRNEADLDAMAVPRKYLELGTFYKYYSGEQIAPIPTVFIGGNHESSAYLWELYHGGWVCPNIYFLGWGNVINVGGLRIGGMSGIYKSGHYEVGHYETPPYNDNHKRSIYHIRKFDVYKMLQVKEPVDVFLSHDWPRGIEQFGDVDGLIKKKPFFREEIQRNELGSLPFEQVLNALKPSHWFSAHLHVRFTANVPWKGHQQLQQQQQQQQQQRQQSQPLHELPNNPDEIKIDFDEEGDTIATSASSRTPADAIPNPDEIPIDFEDDNAAAPSVDSNTKASVESNPDEIKIEDDEGENDVAQSENQPESTSKASSLIEPTAVAPMETAPTRARQRSDETKFLALDKCLPRRQFLEIITIPDVNEPVQFRYDQEWLAIVRTLDKYMSLQHQQRPAPSGKRLERELEENRRWVLENITGDKLLIPSNFVQTTPPHNPVHTLGPKEKHDYNLPHLNPQTEAFCELLQIPNQINAAGIQGAAGHRQQFAPPAGIPPPMHMGHQQGHGGFNRPSPSRGRYTNPRPRGTSYNNNPRGSPHQHHWRPRQPMNQPPLNQGGGLPQPPHWAMNLPPPNYDGGPSQLPRQPMNLPPPNQGGGPSQPPRLPMNLPPPSQGAEPLQPPRRPMNLPPPTAGAEPLQAPRRSMNLPPPVNQP